MGKSDCFVHRRRGLEPSQIPAPERDEFLRWTYEQPDEAVYKVEPKPDFKYTPIKGSVNRSGARGCGKYGLDRYVRIKFRQPVWIPWSGYWVRHGTRGIEPCKLQAMPPVGPEIRPTIGERC